MSGNVAKVGGTSSVTHHLVTPAVSESSVETRGLLLSAHQAVLSLSDLHVLGFFWLFSPFLWFCFDGSGWEESGMRR